MRQFLSTGFLLGFAAFASGQTFTTSRVAQTGDTPPGTAATFPNNFSSGFPAVHSDGTASFVGTIGGVPRVYTGVSGGPISLAVDTGTAIPSGGAATFQDFGSYTGNGTSGVAFWGANAAATPTLQGLYLKGTGDAVRFADTTVIAPGQATPFTELSSSQTVSVNGDNVAFRASYAGGTGLYARYDGSLVRVADSGTAVPNGAGNFTTLSANQILSGSVTVFRGSGTGGQQGIYLRDLSNAANLPVRVTDKSLLLPGTAGLITTISEPSVSGNNVTVIASSGTSTQRVLRYVWNGSSTAPAFTESVLVKVGDAVPGTATTFTGITVYSPSDGANAAFLGAYNDGAARTGVFWHDGATLYKVIDNGQQLDGKTINSFSLGQDAVAGDYLTFQTTFSDTTRGIYVVHFTPVSEPAAALAASTAALGGLAGLRRRFLK